MKYLGPPQSGSLANQTFSRNQFGQYSRNRIGRGGTPVYDISGAVSAWQALTFEQQLAWEQWSKLVPERNSLGSVLILPGAQRFISSWLLATSCGATPPSDPPTERSRGVLIPTLIQPGSPLNISVNAVIEGSGRPQLQASWPGSSTGTNSPPGRRCYWVTVFSTATLVSGPFGTAFAMPTAGRRAWVRGRVIREDWTVSPWVNCGFAIVP